MISTYLTICFFLCIFFFFKQKTAYEMRISDWSSDVCSSDLGPGSVYPTQAIGPAQVVVAAGFRGVQHVDDVAGARIATCFTNVARQHLECDALVLLDAVDRCRGAVDLAARHEQAAGGGHPQQAQYHCNHQFDQRETTLRCLRRGWHVRQCWLVLLM